MTTQKENLTNDLNQRPQKIPITEYEINQLTNGKSRHFDF